MSDALELTADEQALLDADQADKAPVEQPAATTPEPAAPATPEPAEQISGVQGESEASKAARGEETPATVPYSALAEERAHRRELQKQKQALAEKLARYEGQLEGLSRVYPGQQKPEQAAPTPEEQPIRVLTDVARKVAEMEAREQANTQWGQFSVAVQAAFDGFSKDNPDLNDALKHLEAGRIAELQTIGVPETEIGPLLQQERVQIASMAFQKGKNPAEQLYELAKLRGYAKAAPAPTPGATSRGPDGKFTAAEKLATVARGQQQAGKSLSGAGGGGGGEYTLESIANMTDAEFRSISDEQWRKMWSNV